MAVSVTKTRTNYFAVKDKEAFAKLVNNLVTDGNDKAKLVENSQGEVGFVCSDSVYGLKLPTDPDDEDERDYDAMESEMVKQIQALIKSGHACIITDITYENLRFLNGTAMIITQDKFEVLNLRNLALERARDMLDISNYEPDMDC